MASDVGVKLSVSGVSQFKSSMNTAKSSVKALDAELKLNAAQYKATGDAETYMANRTKLLGDQIKSQEEVVANAQKALEAMAAQGVDKASASYTQMQAALAKAKTDLVNMQAAAKGAGDELTKVGDSSSEMSNSLKSIDKGIKFQNLTSALDKVDGMLKNILSSAINIGKSIWDWGKDAASWADDTLTNAMMYGLDVETYQRYESAAGKIDTSVEAIIKANDKLLASTKDAQDGMALITVGEEQYGVAVKDVNGQTRDQLDIFWDVLQIMRSIENETDRNTLAQEYFGKSYRELIPLLEKGKDAWDEAAAAASTVGEEDVNALGNLSDKLQDFDEKWEATTRTLMAKLAPAIETVADALMHMMDLLGEWASSPEGQKAISNIGDSIANLIMKFATTDFEALFDKATGAVEKIAEFLSTITSEDMLKGIKAVAGAIAGIKLAEGTIRGLTLLSSLRGNGTTVTTNGGTPVVTNNPTTTTTNGGLPLLVVRAAEGAGTGYLTYQALSNIMEMPESEAKGWATAAGIGTLINPFLGAGIGGLGALIGGHASGDAEDDIYFKAVGETGTKINGKKVYMNRFGELFTEDEIKKEKVGGTEFLSSGTYGGIHDIMSLSGYTEKGEADPFADDDFRLALRNLVERGINPDETLYGLTQLGDNYGMLITLTETGDMYLQAIEDVNAFFEELNAEMEAANAEITESGVDLGESAIEGFTDNIAAAYDAGASLAAAFVAGASSVGAGGGSAVYNSEYINAININGVTNPAEIALAYQSWLRQNQAGYGG